MLIPYLNVNFTFEKCYDCTFHSFQIMDELRVYERTLRVYAHQMGRLYQQHDCKDDLLRLGGDGDQQTLVS